MIKITIDTNPNRRWNFDADDIVTTYLVTVEQAYKVMEIIDPKRFPFKDDFIKTIATDARD